MATKTFKIGLSNTDKQNMAQDVYERLLALTFPEYDTSATYSVGDFVVYNDQLYKCIGATSGAWDSTKWQLATLNDLVTDIEDAVAFVNDKANVDGNYPTMTVGLAGNLDTKIVDNDVNAYLFRPTGGLDTESGNNCKEKAIVGGSLGFNQLFRPTNSKTDPTTGVVITNNGDGSLTITGTSITTGVSYMSINAVSPNFIQGHKYLLKGNVSGDYGTGYVGAYGTGGQINIQDSANRGVIGVANITEQTSVWLAINPGYAYNCKVIPQVIDLTAMFGSTIADYIYALEQGNAGAGVAWFKRYFNKPYYPYTPIGGFTNVITRGKKAVGFNQAKSIEVGSSTTQDSGALYLEIADLLPNTYYCLTFTSKNGNSYYINEDLCDYVAVIATGSSQYIVVKTKSDISKENVAQFDASKQKWIILKNNQSQTPAFTNVCFNFHYDGERDGEYEPYRKEIYENDAIELIGIPQKDDQGNLYFDGNRYLPNGTVEERYGIVDLGNLTWINQSTGIYYATIDDMFNGYNANNRIQCPSYDISNLIYNSADRPDKTIGIREEYSAKRIYVKDSALNGMAVEQVATYLSGKYFFYKKDEPTTSQASSYPETQWVDNWGTEERLPPLNDTRPCEIPVGHDTDYPLDLKSKLEIMPNSPSADGDYVLHSASGVNTYVALGSWLSTNGWVKLTDITGYDATKTQTLKNVEGTLTWIDD